MQNESAANHLAQETSPYLLQHMHNPVDWHPWNDSTLELARRSDKPILLSIGYSACHWCHVMAHESFEDPATATKMNDLFVNIKVDREERPDLDKIYQLAHQLLSRRSGGWPLTVFLNPKDLVPFFTGTYFPKESRYNLPGFVPLLEKVSDYYHENTSSLEQGKEQFINALNSITGIGSVSSTMDVSLLSRVTKEMEKGYDPVWGGFGSAPKFPHPTSLDFLLRRHARENDSLALQMALFSLRRMAEGGIYDQLGGGFCRYSVDAEWNIPHFEKMLYDNGPLLGLYCQAWQITGKELFRNVAIETAEWVLREMKSPGGAFYSSLDADSEGEEGRFYAWNRQEVKSLLSKEEFEFVSLYYGLGETPNFESHWHLYVASSTLESAALLGIDIQAAEELLISSKSKLMATRATRIRPGLDDKILTSWNALMIKGLSMAGRILHRDDCSEAAVQAFNFLKENTYQEGRLLATWKNGQARFPAYLDDYAFLLEAALELLQNRWDHSVLNFAITLAENLLERFEDEVNGGFFFTAHDHENLIHRPKSMMDEAMPSGNGVAALALNRLGHLLGEERFMRSAERTLKAAMQEMAHYPPGYGALLNAFDEWACPPQIIIIRGINDEMDSWQQLALGQYAPSRLCLAIPATETNLPGLLNQRKPEKVTVAYVCEAAVCKTPIYKLDQLQSVLNS